MINLKEFSKVGIVGYGAYVPAFRLTVDEVCQTWGKSAEQVISSLGVNQKAVAGQDEDCLTMAVEASLTALKMSGLKPDKIGACFIGSESFSYSVKPTSTTLAQILGFSNDYFCADLQFACKAATAGLQIVAAMIESGMIDYGLVVGADKSQSRPGDALEYTAASAAVAFVLGGKPKEWLASLLHTSSYCSDTPDFWRRSGQKFPSHTGRFTGEPAYFNHIITCSGVFLKKTGKKASDFNWAVFHSPNKKFPTKAAKMLGFNGDQMKYSLLVENIGNPYSASTLVSLVNVLDHANSRERIFMTSYGSGAGSDSFVWKTTKNLAKAQNKKEKLIDQLKKTKEIFYSQYLQKMEVL